MLSWIRFLLQDHESYKYAAGHHSLSPMHSLYWAIVLWPCHAFIKCDLRVRRWHPHSDADYKQQAIRAGAVQPGALRAVHRLCGSRMGGCNHGERPVPLQFKLDFICYRPVALLLLYSVCVKSCSMFLEGPELLESRSRITQRNL